jgi:hypothetical protein
MLFRAPAALLTAGLLTGAVAQSGPAQSSPAPDLARAGANRGELERALREVPAGRRPLLERLLLDMPDADARQLTAAFLLQQVELAGAAREQAPWGKELDDELFLAFVLPYAQANERREDWRSAFAARFWPLVRGCRTPGEAAQKLNAGVFAQVGVHYSTTRAAPDQSPAESIAQGKATCTGLAILLADACRSCCVPARLVSVRWPHHAGNHTWVEVWDGAAWRCCGADEPDPHGLDHGWFLGDAARCANADDAHRIWAVCFSPTGRTFAAGWDPAIRLPGIDVTARYAPAAAPADGTAAAAGGAQAVADEAVRAQCALFFAADAAAQAQFAFDRNLDRALATEAGDARLRALAFAAFRSAPHAELRADFAAHRVRAGDKESPYVVKEVGSRPAGGWALVIAMHGGGGVAKAVNDQQWQHMQIYYRDHPEAGGYLYCALRAPTDEWNGFYTDYVYPLVERLIRQFVVCGDVDPDRVYAIGYSHGGYGAFAIGPKLPHRFAAVHASASAPTDGQTAALGLHSLPFTFMVGGRDTAYGRRERCEAFDRELQALQQQHPGRYPYSFTLVEGNGHTGLPDRDLLPQLLQRRREVLGREMLWQLTDGVVRDHYWLRVDAPAAGQRLEAVLDTNTLRLGAATVSHAEAWLDARSVDIRQPLHVVDGERRSDVPLRPSLATLCRTLQERGDPQLAATCIVTLR